MSIGIDRYAGVFWVEIDERNGVCYRFRFCVKNAG